MVAPRHGTWAPVILVVWTLLQPSVGCIGPGTVNRHTQHPGNSSSIFQFCARDTVRYTTGRWRNIKPAGATATVQHEQSSRFRLKYPTVKALMFLFYASLGAVMPYLPVYYHHLGISDRHIGSLGAITPAVTFLVSPLWGALTDKTGKLKQTLLFTFVTSVLFRLALALSHQYRWIATVITVTAIVNAPVRPLLDSSVLDIIDDRKEYGKQRLWGQAGFGVGAYAVGEMLATYGFQAAFYVHAFLAIPTLGLLLFFTPKPMPKEPPKFKQGFRLLVRNKDAIVFFALVFAIGLSSGVIENFAYKRLRELGAGGALLGSFRLMSSLAGIPMFFFSGALTKHLSVMGVLMWSLLSYIIRFFIYAHIKNPRAGMPAELLRGLTFAAFWAASTYHAHRIAPPGLSATMLGILNAVYGGIGQSAGSLLGGALSTRFGTARAFQLYAGVDIVLLVFFVGYWRLRPHTTRIIEKEPNT